ncbi:MAG: transposase [Acidobacteriota bacterium]
MSRPLRVEYPGAVYHVTSRGNGRQPIFLDDGDRGRFLEILARAVRLRGWLVHAYCLMGNHYHLLLETPQGNLSLGMRGLNGEYTQAFNRRHRRCGHVFRGRFNAVLLEKQSHLLELCRYVVLNPVRARGMRIGRPEEWRGSSYRATVGLDPAPPYLATDWVLGQFGRVRSRAREAYARFVQAGLEERGTARRPAGGLVLGSREFLREVRERIGEKDALKEHPRRQRLVDRPALESLLSEQVLRDPAARREAVREAFVQHGYRLWEIGKALGVYYSTVSRMVNKQDEKG